MYTQKEARSINEERKERIKNSPMMQYVRKNTKPLYSCNVNRSRKDGSYFTNK